MTEAYKEKLMSKLACLNDGVVKQVKDLSKISKEKFEEIEASFKLCFEEIEYTLKFFKREEEESSKEEEC